MVSWNKPHNRLLDVVQRVMVNTGQLVRAMVSRLALMVSQHVFSAKLSKARTKNGAKKSYGWLKQGENKRLLLMLLAPSLRDWVRVAEIGVAEFVPAASMGILGVPTAFDN